jgi:flagellar hook-associated protein 2
MATSALSLTGSSTTSSSTGLDVQSTVDQLMYAERAPERLLQNQQSTLNAQQSAFNDINSKLAVLEQKLYELRDPSGAVNARSAASSNTQLLTASADAGATTGPHTVTVERLATVSSWYSTASSISDGSSFDIKVGDGPVTTIQFESSNNTLESAVSYINGLGLGVTANVINDATGARITLVSQQSGAAGNIIVNNDSSGLGLSSSVQGLNAKLTVDGIPVESSTNTVSGVISGVTLNLAGQAPGTQVSLNIAPDTARATAAINSFVSAYNAVIGAINAQFTFDTSSQQAGVLSGNATLRDLQSRLLGDSSYSLNDGGHYTSMAAIGVDMANDGTLSVNSSELQDALSNHYGDLQTFLQGTEDAFANRFGADLTAMTDTIEGPVSLALNGIKADNKNISDQIDSLEVRYAVREQQLFDEYSRVDMMLRQLPTLQAQISAQLGSLTTK